MFSNRYPQPIGIRVAQGVRHFAVVGVVRKE
jgi:hypothetical protein